MKFKPSYYWSFTVFRNKHYRTLYLGCGNDGGSLLLPMKSKRYPDPRVLFITNKYVLDSLIWELYIIRDHRGTNFLTTVRVNGEKVTQPKVKTIALIWPRALTWSINTCYILHTILVKLNQIIACMFQKYIFYGNEAGNYFLSWRNSLSNSEFQLC